MLGSFREGPHTDFDEQAGEQWLILLPKKWNPKTHKQVYSWRWDPSELSSMCAAGVSTPHAHESRKRRGVCRDMSEPLTDDDI